MKNKTLNVKLHKKAGAPKGGRVHWLLFCLSELKEVQEHYTVTYEYSKHEYFIRYNSNAAKELEFFVIQRSSKPCFKTMYYKHKSFEIVFENCKTPIATYQHIKKLIQKSMAEREREI